MTLRLNGSTSGYTEIDAPAVAGSNTLVLPTGNGSSGQVLSTNGSGALSWAPAVRQVVQGTLTTFFSTTATFDLNDTVPQNTKGAEFLTASITPSSSASKVLVRAVAHVANNNASYINAVALFKDSVANALAASWSMTVVANTPVSAMVLEYLDSPSTASSITYKLRGGTVGGTGAQTFQINGGSGVRYLGGSLITTLTLMEVAP